MGDSRVPPVGRNWKPFASLTVMVVGVLLLMGGCAAALVFRVSHTMAAESPRHSAMAPPVLSPDELLDAEFLVAITKAGVPVGDRDDAVHAARGACTHLADPEHDIGSLIAEVQAARPSLPSGDAGTFAALAIKTYCPEKQPR